MFDATCVARGIAQELESLLEQVKSTLLLRDAEPSGKRLNSWIKFHHVALELIHSKSSAEWFAF